MSSSSPQGPEGIINLRDGRLEPIAPSAPMEMAELDSSRASNGTSAVRQPDMRETGNTTPTQSTSTTVGGTASSNAQWPLPGPTEVLGTASMPSSTQTATREEEANAAAVVLPELKASTEQGGPGSVVFITLLMISGTRHAYRIDDKYLKKHNVQAPNHDPYEISVYTLKELILREWLDGHPPLSFPLICFDKIRCWYNVEVCWLIIYDLVEWDMKPSSPSSIRLIHFGRLLDDKSALRGSFY